MNCSPTETRSEEANRERWELADRAAAAQAADRHGLASLARVTGRPLTTLRRWAWVARRYPPDKRRCVGLGFAHHEAAGASERRFEIVAQAEKQGWSVARVRMEVRADESDRGKLREGAVRRGPQCLEEASAYLQQLASLKSDVAEGVQKRVLEVAGLAETLERKWNHRPETEDG